jgi:signal transduction histidine kinase
MSSIRLKITLLFLLVAIPLVLEILYQNRLASSIALGSRTTHVADLTLAQELVSITRLSAESRRADLQHSRVAPPAWIADLKSAGARLAQLEQLKSETRALRKVIATLVEAAASSSAPESERLKIIVEAEIQNLLIRRELSFAGKDKKVAEQVVDLRSTALWTALLLLSLGALVTWVFASRYTTALHSLTRDIQRLSHAHGNQTIPTDEVAEVTHAFSNLCDTISHTMVDRQYLEDLLNSMSESVVVSDLMGNVVYSNAAAKKLFDAGARGMVGVDTRCFIDLSWSSTDTEGNAWYDGPLQSDVDSSLHIFARRTHLVGEGNALEGTVYVIQDVSESRELMRANFAYRDRLSRSERLASFGTLGAIVAHKFSQPLSSVRLFLQQVQRELSHVHVSETVKSNLSESLSELGRIADITKQMVASGRMVATENKSQRAEVGAAVERVFESLSEVADRRHVSLYNLCGENRDAVAFTAFELEEILYCLINNSIQAAPDERPTQVTVSAQSHGEETTILVCDTGRGISPEHLDKIFEWCFTTKAEGQGTGLGLAIVRSIIERHGGRITVSSEERAGSRFTILLPMAKEGKDDGRTECIYC